MVDVAPFLALTASQMSKSQEGRGLCRPGTQGLRLFPLQLPHSAGQAKAEAEVPRPEEASMSPVEALLCFPWGEPCPAEAVQPGAERLGPGCLRCERPLAGRGQAWFQ